MSQKETKSSKCLGSVAPVESLVAPLHNLSLRNAAVGVNVQSGELELSEAEKKSASLVFSTLLSSWKDFTSTEGTESQAGLSYKLHQLAGIDTNTVDSALLNMRRKVFNQKALEVDGRHCSPMFSKEQLSPGQEEHSSYHVATAITSPMLGCMMHPKGKEFGIAGAAATVIENGWKRFRTNVDIVSFMKNENGGQADNSDYFKFFDMSDNFMLVGKASMTCVPERDAVIKAYDQTLRDVDVEDKNVRFGNRMRRVLANHMRVMHSVLQACTEDYEQSEDGEKRQIWSFLNAQCCATTDRNNVSKLAYDAMTAVVSDIVTQQTCKEYYEHVRKLFDPRPRDEKGGSSTSSEVLRSSELLKMGNTPITKEEWSAWNKRLKGSQSEIMKTDTMLALFSDWFKMLVRVASRSNIQGDALWYGTSCMNLHLFICMDNSACNWRCHSSTTIIDAHNQEVAKNLNEMLEGMEERVSKAFDTLDLQTSPLEQVQQKVENVRDLRDNSIDARDVMNVAAHSNVYKSVQRTGAVTRSQTNAKAAREAKPHSIPSDGIIFLHPDDEEGETRDAKIAEAYELIVLNSKKMVEMYGDITMHIASTKKSYTEWERDINDLRNAPTSEQTQSSLESKNCIEQESQRPEAPSNIGGNLDRLQGAKRRPRNQLGYTRGKGPHLYWPRVKRAQSKAAAVHRELRDLHRRCRDAETCRADIRYAKQNIKLLLGSSKSMHETNLEIETHMQLLSESDKRDESELLKLQQQIKDVSEPIEKLRTLLQDEDAGEQDSADERNERARKRADAMELWLEKQDDDQPVTREEVELAEFLNDAWQFTDSVDMSTALVSLNTASEAVSNSTKDLESAELEKENHARKAQIFVLQAWSHVTTHSRETFEMWYTRLFEGSSSIVFDALNWLRHDAAKTMCRTVWKYAKLLVLKARDGVVTYLSIRGIAEPLAKLLDAAGCNFLGSFGDTASMATGVLALFVTMLPGIFDPTKVNLALGSIITYNIFEAQFMLHILSNAVSLCSKVPGYISSMVLTPLATGADYMNMPKVATVLRAMGWTNWAISMGGELTSWGIAGAEHTVAGLGQLAVQGARDLNDVYAGATRGTRDSYVPNLDPFRPEMNPMSLVIKVVVVRKMFTSIYRLAPTLRKTNDAHSDKMLLLERGVRGFYNVAASVVTYYKAIELVGTAINAVVDMGLAPVRWIDNALRGNVAYDYFASFIRYVFHLPSAILAEFGSNMIYKCLVQRVWPEVQDWILYRGLPPELAKWIFDTSQSIKNTFRYSKAGILMRYSDQELLIYLKKYAVEWILSPLQAIHTYIATLSPEAQYTAMATIATLFAISVSVAVIRKKKRERGRTNLLTLSDTPKEDDRTKMQRLQGPTQTLIESHIGGKEFALAVAFLEMAMVSSA